MFYRRSVDSKTILVPLTYAHSTVIFYDCDVMELNVIVTSLLTSTMAGVSAFYRLGVTIILGISISILQLDSSLHSFRNDIKIDAIHGKVLNPANAIACKKL